MENFTRDKTYDSVFWTGVVRLTPFLIPLVNEVFGTHYSDQTSTRLLPMKQVTKQPDQTLKERETDSLAELRDQDDLPSYYHFEVETWPDSSIAIRIAEYAAGTAFSNIRFTADGAKMTIPHSAVIILRKTSLEDFYLTIEYPDGSVKYKIPVFRMADYTLEDLLRKKLYLLLPFFGFSYVNSKDELNEEAILIRFREDLDRICLNFDKARRDKLLDDAKMRYLLELIQQVMHKLFAKNKKISGEVDKTMGGKILELETDRMIATSKDWGSIEKLISQTLKKVKRNKTFSDIVEELESDDKEIRPIYEAVLKYGTELPPEEIRKKMEAQKA